MASSSMNLTVGWSSWAMLATRLAWESLTPFGRPVVPELYGSQQVEAGSMEGRLQVFSLLASSTREERASF